MALTTRERYIMIAAFIAVGILVLNSMVLVPVSERRSLAKQEREDLSVDWTKAKNVLERKDLLENRWKKMQKSGLSNDIENTESTILRFLKECSSDNNLSLSSIQPERLSSKDDLGEIDFILSCTGDMYAVTEFLSDLETGDVPIKLKTVQLGSKDESGALMTLQLKLSSIYINDQKEEKEQSL